jgi:threonine synthase
VDLKEVVLKGLPEDNGLYMPEKIIPLHSKVLATLNKLSFQEIAFEVARSFLEGDVPLDILEEIVYDTIQFPAPLKELKDKIYVQELFHGPSMAFKDFGARFMARLMGHLYNTSRRPLIILVATSGDTGGAVAAGFHGTPGIQVVILYPSGKVTEVQETQLTSKGDNIFALEVNGTFDDCQKLVKQAFLDASLNTKLLLSSANSINLSRLYPQTFYYFESAKYFMEESPPSFIVPSGNFGNITAGLMAKIMGAPIGQLIASTNQNDTFFNYLKTGNYLPKTSVQTYANAMDVGNPSNFARIKDLFLDKDDGSTWNNIRRNIKTEIVQDTSILSVMRNVYQDQNYLLDPHTATAHYTASLLRENLHTESLVLLGTAHPVKFQDVILQALPNINTRIFEGYEEKKEKRNHEYLENNFEALKNKLLKLFHVKQY